jgi:hypothetical protein
MPPWSCASSSTSWLGVVLLHRTTRGRIRMAATTGALRESLPVAED